MEFILVVLIYAGAFAKGDSVALQALPGWSSRAACEQAGRELEPLVKATSKEVRFVCVKR
jgi:hypothetical protein